MSVEADWLITDRDINAALGAQVRLAREAAGHSRPELVALLPFSTTVATLLNWELGHRSIAYARLVELARVLNRTAPSLLRAAIEHVESIESMFVELDLRPLCEDGSPRFGLLRIWAKRKFAMMGNDADGIVRVHHAVVRELAVLLNLHVPDLVQHLKKTACFAETSCASAGLSRKE